MTLPLEYHVSSFGIPWEFFFNTIKIVWEFHQKSLRIPYFLGNGGIIRKFILEFHGNLYGIP